MEDKKKNNKNNKKKLKSTIPNIILALFFVIGLSIFLYPSISDFINNLAQNRDISQYEDKISQLSFEDYDKRIEEAREYNRKLVGHNITYNADLNKTLNYDKILSVDDSGMIGYLRIPKIKVKLPIFHTTDATILQRGIGHMEGTSLPVDSETYHCVLSGHTGLPSSKLLTDLVDLEVGDEFYITVFNKIYTYKVDQILVVKPEETDALEIVEGKQFLTLVTCTPYGVNTHRLLVRGVLRDNMVNEEAKSEGLVLDSSFLVIGISIPIMIILFIVLINIRKRIRIRKEYDEKNNEKEDNN